MAESAKSVIEQWANRGSVQSLGTMQDATNTTVELFFCVEAVKGKTVVAAWPTPSGYQLEECHVEKEVPANTCVKEAQRRAMAQGLI
jgi:sulfur relay (sulfurtransferase) complex TusBCD TusD component (DsrE family)